MVLLSVLTLALLFTDYISVNLDTSVTIGGYGMMMGGADDLVKLASLGGGFSVLVNIVRVLLILGGALSVIMLAMGILLLFLGKASLGKRDGIIRTVKSAFLLHALLFAPALGFLISFNICFSYVFSLGFHSTVGVGSILIVAFSIASCIAALLIDKRAKMRCA